MSCDTSIRSHQPTSNLYGYADVGHFGLAHSLLAWARCRLWTYDNNLPMLSPNWFHIRGRIGPHIRKERDKRQYQKLFRYPGYITGLPRLLLLGILPRVKAEEIDLSNGSSDGRRGLVVFSNSIVLNSEIYFKEIIGRHIEVRRFLMDITKPKYYPPRLSAPHIAIHIRLGDFSKGFTQDMLRSGNKNSRLPIDWYANLLRQLQRELQGAPAIVYSDGADAALEGILRLPGVERAPRQSAITDLLSIAQAKLLISSGSGFSQWGAFLGNVPRICFPGQRFIRVLGDPVGLDLEPECEEATDIPNELISHLQSALQQAAPTEPVLHPR